MNSRPLLYPTLFGFTALALSACSVYRPTIPALPAIQAAHEAEVKAGVDLNGFMGFTAAYSPVKYLLVSTAASASWHSPNVEDASRQAVQRQGEVSAGAYVPLGSRTVISVQGGVGKAHSFDSQSSVDTGFLSTFPSYRKNVDLIHARTQTTFLQAGWQRDLTQKHIIGRMGVGYRLGRQAYRQYTVTTEEYNRNGDLLARENLAYPLPTLMRHDILAQFNFGTKLFPALQLQLGMGLSFVPNMNRWNEDYSDLGWRVRSECSGTYLGQASLAFYPHLLRKAK